MNNILSDTSRFKKVDKEDIFKVNLNHEDKINYQVRQMKKKSILSENEYNELYVSGSSPSVMYGLPKVHKENIPLRPILAAFKAPSYKLAKFLSGFLQPLASNPFTIKNSYDFKNQLKELHFQDDIYIASFDITNLYTNIPVRETINIVLESLYRNTDYIQGMVRSLFKKLLELCVGDNHFIFNERHYIQHEGFAMGSPLSATMANIFLCHHETKWLDECPTHFKPLLYKRYVDDTFLIFKERQHIESFFNYLNGKHPNINFTKEYESDGKLSFLDMNVKKEFRDNVTSFNFNIFRKRTFTGLGLNYHSYTYYNFKLNSIRTLVFRAYQLCTTWIDFHNELSFILKFFKKNGYPEALIFRVFNKFLQNIFSPKPKVISVPKLTFYVKFPFLNNICSNFMKKELGTIFGRKYPHIDFKFLFVNNITIKSILNHKERLPSDLCSGLVYLYKCSVCNASYIGQTMKSLRTRANEHLGLSARTGCLLARPSHSAVRDHIHECGTSRSVKDFSVLRNFNNQTLLRIYESLEINSKKPVLNNDSSSYPLLML